MAYSDHLVNSIEPFVMYYFDQILASVRAPVTCDYQIVQFATVPGQIDEVDMYVISRDGNDTARRKISSSLYAKLRI